MSNIYEVTFTRNNKDVTVIVYAQTKNKAASKLIAMYNITFKDIRDIKEIKEIKEN